MNLDVIVPTHNREALLARTLDSLLAAERPEDLEVRVIVGDNASTDGTAALVRRQAPRFKGGLQYLFVREPGKAYVLNACLAATSGELVGFIDDDEEIDPGWFRCVRREFGREEVDFIGGKCLPRWEAPAPAWLGDGYLGVIGWVDPGDAAQPMDETYPGILMGGNAVVRRSLLARVGEYSTSLNRTGQRLLGCEDEDMYQRLLASGGRGLYRPDLVIHHFVPKARLTRRYFRKWCFWRGVSRGLIDRSRPAAVVYLGGIPRYLYGRAARGLLRIASPRRGGPAARFASELALWDLAGFAYGKLLYRVPQPRAAGAASAVRAQNPVT